MATTKQTTEANTADTVNADMSLWAMFKHFTASVFNVTIHLADGVNQFADAFNNIGQATNAGSRVVKDYALIEESEAMSLLADKRSKLN